MAAKDHYGSTPAYHIPDVNFDNPPLPPPASEKPSNTRRISIGASGPATFSSPVRSPFDDDTYTTSYPPTFPEPGRIRTQYSGSRTATTQPEDPFADNVPLRQYPSYQGSDHHTGNTPMQRGTNVAEDSERFPQGEPNTAPELEGGKRRRRGRRQFDSMNPKGRTPWFVYFMTLVQVTVFIGELEHNCESLCSSLLGLGALGNLTAM